MIIIIIIVIINVKKIYANPLYIIIISNSHLIYYISILTHKYFINYLLYIIEPIYIGGDPNKTYLLI